MLINAHLRAYAQTLGALLIKHNAKVVTAESCTGGAIAASLTAVEGSSAWLDASFVTYSNAMKTTLLEVPPALIQQQGVVSEAVVKAMVLGACCKVGADYGVAVSGVAGPGGGTAAQPVGTVCIAWGSPQGVITRTFYFNGHRDSIREQAVEAALLGLTQVL